VADTAVVVVAAEIAVAAAAVVVVDVIRNVMLGAGRRPASRNQMFCNYALFKKA
jgi:hypothetical protein